MIDTASAVNEAAASLGIDLANMDEAPSLEAETESTEAESVGENEEVKEATEGEQSEEAPALEEEETLATEQPETKVEEPKLTLKEFQEIQSAREELKREQDAFKERQALMEKEFQEKYHEKIKTHDEMDSFLAQLASNDPDLFDLVKGAFQEHQKQYSNPIINELKQKNDALEKKLDSFLNKASDEVTRTKLDSEINQVKATLGKDAEAAGVKVDYEKVKEVWADNPKLSYKDAMFALYGEQIMKATASKAKVETVEKKVSGRPTVATAGSVKATSAKVEKAVPKDAFGAVYHIAQKLTGKSY